MGPPGAGKGTQAKAVAAKYAIPHISSGDIFRGEIAAGTELGKTLKSYLDAGALVPDATTVKAVMTRLAAKDCANGWLLDGFPRTGGQAEALDAALEKSGSKLCAVANIEVDPETIVSRMGGRRVCPKCGRSYHVEHIPPKTPGKCDACGAAIVQREDDKPETVRARLDTYLKQTAPLIEYYAKRGLLVRVDGSGAPEEVRDRLFAQLEAQTKGA
jgi:adenylate kinase